MKKKQAKEVEYSVQQIAYFKCPHCKNIVLIVPKEFKPTLMKWKKQKQKS